MLTASTLNQTENSKKYLLKSICWLLAIFLGILQTWANRYTVWPDMVSYLDIGDAYLRGDWNAAINGCWSPLYSWLLSLALLILKPSPYGELLVIKLVNFLIYLFTLVSFNFFLKEVIFYHKKTIQDSQGEFLEISEWVWIVLGYALFIWSSIKWLLVYRDSPDMLVAALVYLATGIVLHLYTKSQSWFNFLALGVVLGFGYLSKSIMLPLGLVFLATSLFSTKKLRQTLPRVVIGLLVFTIISAPFITALSLQKGRLTFGDAGKLNYAWYVSPIADDLNWQGLPPGSVTPKHPTRKIFNNPAAFEFGTPINGTFPPWYDPSYWNDGLKPVFNLSLQVKCIAQNIKACYKLFFEALVFCYLILVCVSGRSTKMVKDLMGNWRLLLPASVGLVGFLVMTKISPQAQPWGFLQVRYIAPFVVLLFVGIFTGVRLPNLKESKRWIIGLTIAALFITSSKLLQDAAKTVFIKTIQQESAKEAVITLRKPQHIQWQMSSSLSQLGIKPGDKVAVLGHHDHYWARLSKVKIVASIPEPEKFWAADALAKSEVLQAIEKTGARAIVQQSVSATIPNSTSTIGWQELGNTGRYVYLLQKQSI